MPSVSRGEVVDCSNPKLDVFTKFNGQPVNLYSLEYQIFDAPSGGTQVYPPSGRATADVDQDCPVGDRLETGRHVARWTVPDDEPATDHLIVWYFRLTSVSPEQTWSEEFTVLAVEPSGGSGYTTVQAVRDEGVSVTDASDGRVQAVIELESRRIDAVCGQWFEARAGVYRFDGVNSRVLRLDVPIVQVDEVRLVDDDGATHVVDAADYEVYDRHMSRSQLAPDDRRDPRVEIRAGGRQVGYAHLLGGGSGSWGAGNQSVEVEGLFGFTDPPGPPGATPLLVSHACLLLVMKRLPLMTDLATKVAVSKASSVIRDKTRDQEVWYADTTTKPAYGKITGDAEVDDILAMFLRPPIVGVVGSYQGAR